MRWMMLAGLLVTAPLVAWSQQQPPPTPEDRAISLQYQLNACKMASHQLSQSFADELVAMKKRAEAAEVALAAREKPQPQVPTAVAPEKKDAGDKP